MSRIAFRNFTGGEVTPTLSARYDLQKAGTFLQCCENFIPNIHGDVERRPGWRFLADLGEASVLLPFQFNSDPENNYVLVFGASTIRAFNVRGEQSGEAMASPYRLSDVYDLSYAQVGDVVYLAHSKYALRKLTRSGSSPDYIWTIREVELNKSLDAPGAPTVTWHRGPKSSDSGEEYTKLETFTLSYVVTAVDSNGVESLASPAGEVVGRYPTDWVSGDHVTLTWNAVPGAAEYNIYRESCGYYGLIGVSSSTSFDDQNYEPDTSMTPKEDWNPFENGNNPATVCFHQQRMVLAGTKDGPSTFYMSRTGDYENFRKSRPLQDDDPVEYMLASGSVDEIRWAASFGDLLIGTGGAEYSATSGGAAITPSDVQISTQSYWGSARLQPLIIGQSVLHSQRSGFHVRDLAYSWESDGYAGNDLSLLAPQLVESGRILQWCYQQDPGSCVWAVRGDGVLLCLTYMKEQNVHAWSRHTTAGKVLSAVCLSGAATPSASAKPAVREAASLEFMLRVTLPVVGGADNIIHADCWPVVMSVNGEDEEGEIAFTLETDDEGASSVHLSGTAASARELYSGDEVLWTVTVVDAMGIFADTVSFSGALVLDAGLNTVLVHGGGEENSSVSPLTVAVSDDEEAEEEDDGLVEDILLLVTCRVIDGEERYYLERGASRFSSAGEQADAFYVDGGVTLEYDESTREISGLDHLEGRTVSVLADGWTETHDVRDGAVTLNAGAKKVTVGLSYDSVLAPMPVETDGQNGSTLGRRRAYGKAILRLFRSLGGHYAATRPGDLFDTRGWKGREMYDLVYPDNSLYSGDLEIVLPSGQEADASLWISQNGPQPFRLVAIAADIDFGEV